MTAPIKRYYAVTDLAYDDIEVVVLAGEQETIARRRRIWRRGEFISTWPVRVSTPRPWAAIAALLPRFARPRRVTR